MFDFSLGKLIILALIALLVLGPDKLPGAARTAGALIRRLRNSWDGVRAEVERELEVEEIRRAARQAAADAEATQSEASDTLKRLHDELDKVRTQRLTDDTGARADAAADTAPATATRDRSDADAARTDSAAVRRDDGQ